MAGKFNINFRIIAIAVALLLSLFVLWSYARSWAPSRDTYAVQGIVVSAENGSPNWSQLGATGVDFAYLTATEGAAERDKSFQANMKGAGEAGIRFGALHHFDICRLASDQANLFITTVPRSENALPPAVQLDFSDTCTGRPNRGLILSELATFLGQIEVHSGVPAVLLLNRDFEKEYQISKSIDRNVWLESNWFLPDYSARPWVMWTANSGRIIDGLDGPVRWAVVHE
ncbi:GH25 family lysozyme [Sphingorhabdus arenilitoris]|uniref:GH25 family lysozyme n=1 Tax=Sphingorhabdus arenilitoris TaxID=1490041 RepID=A0ABV8RJB8_9SPHN